MITIFTAVLISRSSLPHIELARILEQPQTTVQRFLGPAFKQRKGPGYRFTVKGFDHFWVLGFGKDMTRLVCILSSSCTRTQALNALGLSDSRASIKPISLGAAPLATRRSVEELTGVTGLPKDKYSHKPWKVFYEEEGVVNQKRKDLLKPRILASTGPARLDLIRQCYDWRPKISIEQ